MIPSCGIVVALGLGLTACTNPYDPIQQALVCAAKYRLFALSESDQLMIRLFDE
jgi:hypothetical protein